MHPTPPDPSRCYVVYTYTLDNAYGPQLSQEYDGHELPVGYIEKAQKIICSLTEDNYVI